MPLQEESKKEKQRVFFREARHLEEIKGAQLDLKNKDDWRKIRERMKTVSVALVLCLNVGVDPPDTKKPLRCARKEAWVEPGTSNPQRSAQKIAQNLQKIYEKLQPRARYKSAIDPTVDCVRKLCTSMRRNAKDERVLFHFNGHGVPKPTDAGEIWVFNKNITQYIPLSLYDLQSWMSVPSVYLWDCNSAGTIVNMFMRFAEDHSIRWMEEYQNIQQQQHHPSPGPSGEQFNSGSGGNDSQLGADRGVNNNDAASNASTSSHSLPTYKNCIQLGACAVGEILPIQNPDLPADLFTCCLITPIQTSILCHMLKLGVKNRFPPNIIDDIPGVLTDRRTLLGELNWIFTAITDTIAWSCLPMDIFQKLFRQDLLIASLFRSFLLAQRIMLENGCHVVSTPDLPSVHNHYLWEYWDYVLDMTLINMYNLLQPKQQIIQFTRRDSFIACPTLTHNLLIELPVSALAETEYVYSWFFIEQLQAFEVWLKFSVDKHKPPEQLPVVLQVLLSQIHRVRALELLARFVDLGPWAVVSALSVGIFPYVLKLLQCGTKELRPALAFIWAKILAIDPVCQHELVKDNGYFYFLQVLNDPSVENLRIKIVSAFVMATIIYNNYRPAQDKLVQSDYVSLCIELLSNQQVIQCRMLCLWILIGLGRLWSECDKARWQAIRNVAYDKAIEFLDDEVPEVRASAVYALGCFVHNTSRNNEHATAVENEVCDKICDKCIYDGSVLVRSELAAAIQWFIIDFQSKFATICIDLDQKIDDSLLMRRPAMSISSIGNGTIHAGAGIEIQKALAALKANSPSKESIAQDLAEMATPTAGPSNVGGRNNVMGFIGNGPKRSQSGSIYSTILRSASSATYSSKRPQRTSPVRKGSLLTKPEASILLHRTPIPPLDSSNAFKYRIVSHITELERKPIIGPFERIWLCVLRLGLDPFKDVAEMGERIIQYIFDLATKIKEARNKALEVRQRPSAQPGSRQQTQSLTVNGRFSCTSAGADQQQQQTGSVQSDLTVKFLVGSPVQCTSSSAAVASNIVQVPEQDSQTTKTVKKNTPSSSGDGGVEEVIASGESSVESSKSKGISTADCSSNLQEQFFFQSSQQQVQKEPPLPQMDNAKRRLLLDPFIHQSLFTPKRSIFGNKSGSYSQVTSDISDALLFEQAVTVNSEGLVRTSFVDWCGKTWTEPIFQTVYEDSSTAIRNSIANFHRPYTMEQPTDWAIHIHDGIKQRSRKEAELLRAKQFRCEQQCVKLKLDRPTTSMTWSFLRPYVYIGDGERVTMCSYPTGDAPSQQKQPQQPMSMINHHSSLQQPIPPPPSRLCREWQVGGESYLLDSVTELMIANGLTHELLMTGSRNGLLKIWDPHFNEHSFEFLDKKPKLITATYLLNDLQRQDRDKGNRTLYHWDQEEGRLICSGNVRVCRVWDAWAEKSIYDIQLRHSKSSVVTVDSDLYCNMVSCGFSDGTMAVFDIRLPSEVCEIMRIRDSNASVVGMGLLRERQRLLVGTRDGFVRLWEPRMFQEPISEFNVANIAYPTAGQNLPNESRLLHHLEVHKNGQFVACAMADCSVYLFDIDGREGVLSRMRYPISGGGGGTSIFQSPSSALGSLASLIRPRRRSSSGGSGSTMDDHVLSSNSPIGSPRHHQQQQSPATMRFHHYRMLLGVANADCQFRAFSMPNVENK